MNGLRRPWLGAGARNTNDLLPVATGTEPKSRQLSLVVISSGSAIQLSTDHIHFADQTKHCGLKLAWCGCRCRCIPKRKWIGWRGSGPSFSGTTCIASNRLASPGAGVGVDNAAQPYSSDISYVQDFLGTKNCICSINCFAHLAPSSFVSAPHCSLFWDKLLQKYKQKWERFTDRSHVPVRLRDRPPRSRSRRMSRSSLGDGPRSACNTTAVTSML